MYSSTNDYPTHCLDIIGKGLPMLGHSWFEISLNYLDFLIVDNFIHGQVSLHALQPWHDIEAKFIFEALGLHRFDFVGGWPLTIYFLFQQGTFDTLNIKKNIQSIDLLLNKDQSFLYVSTNLFLKIINIILLAICSK